MGRPAYGSLRATRRRRSAGRRRAGHRQAGGPRLPEGLSLELARPLSLLLALAIDLALGDPPNRFHPVAWVGRLLAAGRRRLCHGPAAALLAGGAATTIAVAGLAAAASALVSALAARLGVAGLVLEALALASLLSLRGLVGAAHGVAADLGRGDLEAARRAVGYHLVSRTTGALDEAHVVSATVESVAENLTDSVVAPICFFLVGGLAAAAVYRVVNTADAMFGYREGPLEYFGKTAARLDDLLNFVPARIAGLSVVAGSALTGEHARGALAALRSDRRRTASPNAGWTMSAMAGALGVTLEKPGVYKLGAGGLPRTRDIARAVRVFGAACAVSVATMVALYWIVAGLA